MCDSVGKCLCISEQNLDAQRDSMSDLGIEREREPGRSRTSTERSSSGVYTGWNSTQSPRSSPVFDTAGTNVLGGRSSGRRKARRERWRLALMSGHRRTDMKALSSGTNGGFFAGLLHLQDFLVAPRRRGGERAPRIYARADAWSEESPAVR